jgi:predicted nucleic acid-binding protein
LRRIFVDTSFYVALIDRRDDLHAAAENVLDELYDEGSVELVTSDFVLGEVLTFFAGHGQHMRKLAAGLVDRIAAQPAFVRVPASRSLWERAFAHYTSRLDKRYSFVDCTSMVICRELKISMVLSHDQDFEREGLTILL